MSRPSPGALGLLCTLLLTACGQKGPPLPPIVYLPNVAAEYVVKRSGGEVVVQFKVPLTNTDNTNPADLDRVEVYAHTGPLPTPQDFVEYGTLVGTLKVRQPQAPASEESEAAPPAPTGSPEPAGDVEQGWATSISESLTDAHQLPGRSPITRATVIGEPRAEQLETPGTVNLPLPAVRYYTAVGVSRSRNRRGPFTAPVGVPLVPPPAPPEGVVASYTEDTIALSWNRSPGDVVIPAAAAAAASETAGTVNLPETIETPGTISVPGAEPLPAPVDVVPDPAAAVPPPAVAVATPPAAARFGYNVYDAADARTLVTPLNTALLTTPEFKDARLEFGAERCYLVRRVEMAGAIALESPATVPVCVTPVDTFPPPAPRTLASVTSENAVSLIWEPNTNRDLAGYLVLRGEAPGEKLAPLTPSPVLETTYRDETVQAGRSYVYVVVAVDTATPPNVSEHSNRVTEVVR